MFERYEDLTGLIFLPWEPVAGTEEWDSPEYLRRVLNDKEYGFISAMVWQSDISMTYPHAPRRWNVTFSFDDTFDTKEEAMAFMDKVLVENGAMLLKEKHMVML
jgi:hypothetical protein